MESFTYDFNFVSTELEVGQFLKSLQVLDDFDLILHEIEILQVGQGLNVLNSFDFVEREVEIFQIGEMLDTARNMIDSIIIQIKLFYGEGKVFTAVIESIKFCLKFKLCKLVNLSKFKSSRELILR